MWAGIAGAVVNNNAGYEIAISVHDSVYNTDFSSSVIPYTPNQSEEQSAAVEEHVIQAIRKFSSEHLCKFLGAGVTLSLLREASPHPIACHLPRSDRLTDPHRHPTSAPASGSNSTSSPSCSTSSPTTQTPQPAPT